MLGERIKALRKKLKLTQMEFAAKIGMTNRAVHEWEKNKVEIKESSLRLIETIFEVNPLWLRNGEGNMFEPESEKDISPQIRSIVIWLKSLNEERQTWIKVEMCNRFDEYKKWLEENPPEITGAK